MSVFRVVKSWFATDQVLEAGKDLAAVIQSRVGNGGSVDSKVGTVEHYITGGQTGNIASMKSDRK